MSTAGQFVKKNVLMITFFCVLSFILMDSIIFLSNNISGDFSFEKLYPYFEHLNAKFPNSLFTIAGALFIFKYGTQELENRKQLTSFHEKYIKLKSEIDLNRKSLLNCDDVDLIKELDKMSDSFIKYTNLFYEEDLAMEYNSHIKSERQDWIISFNNEITVWQNVVEERLQRISYEYSVDFSDLKISNEAVVQPLESLLRIADAENVILLSGRSVNTPHVELPRIQHEKNDFENGMIDDKALFKHNQIQQKIRFKFNELNSRVSSRIELNLSEAITKSIDDLCSFALNRYKERSRKFNSLTTFESELNERRKNILALAKQLQDEYYRKSG